MSLPRSNDMVRARQRLRRLLATIDDPELRAEIERELERIDVIDRRDKQYDKVRGDLNIQADRPTANRRVYSRELLERTFQAYQEQINRRRAYGVLGPVDDNRTRFRDVSHLVTGVELAEDGTIQAEIEVLPTSQGIVLRELLQSGVSMQLSPRGYGTVGPDGVVQDDYQLTGFDVVPDDEARTRGLDAVPFTTTSVTLAEPDEDDDGE